MNSVGELSLRLIAMASLVACCPGPAAAEPLAAQPSLEIRPARVGDCVVFVQVPDLLARIDVYVDSTLVDTRFEVSPKQDPNVITLRLDGAIKPGSQSVTVTRGAGTADAMTVTRDVGTPDDKSPGRLACTGKAVNTFDTRPVFEAVGYVGKAFDNFAPKDGAAYDNPRAANEIQSRWIGGLIVDYHVPLSRHSDNASKYQLWVTGSTLNGVRTADVLCTSESDPNAGSSTSPLCQPVGTNPGGQLLTILEHASTIEAHFDTRLEFLTLQTDSDTPVKAFVIARFGFVDLAGSSKVFEVDHVGLGVLVPMGSFRGSSVQWAFGRTTLFTSHPGWDRLKINARLAFDVLPGLKEKAEFWKYLGFGSLRAFLNMSIDRNPWGPGPDSVQTYFGMVFDLRRAFVPQP